MEFEILKDIITEVMDIDKSSITMDKNFKEDLCCDSIELLQIIMKVEEKFNISISNEDLLSIKTVEDAVERMKDAKK